MNPLVEGCRQWGLSGAAVTDEEATDEPGARSQAHDWLRDRNGSPEPAARAPGEDEGSIRRTDEPHTSIPRRRPAIRSQRASDKMRLVW